MLAVDTKGVCIKSYYFMNILIFVKKSRRLIAELIPV